MAKPIDRFLLRRELSNTLQLFRSSRPNDTSDLERRFEVVIVQLEKAYGYYDAFIYQLLELAEKEEL